MDGGDQWRVQGCQQGLGLVQRRRDLAQVPGKGGATER